MKNAIYIPLILIFHIGLFPLLLFSQPIESGVIFGLIESKASTNFLLNRAYWNIDSRYTLTPSEIATNPLMTNPKSWVELYQNMKIAEVRADPASGERIFSEKLKDLVPIPNDVSVDVPIGLIYLDVDYIPQDSIAEYTDTTIFFSSISPDAPLESGTVFSVSTLRSFMCAQNINFNIDPDLFFTNKFSEILGLKIDFGDGHGFRNYDLQTTTVPIYYSTLGDKTITFKLVTTQGILTISNTLRIYPDLIVATRDTVSILQSNAENLDAYFDVYLGCDSILDKPVVIVGGFEVFGPSSPKDVAAKYFDAGIFTQIINQGYDFVAVGFEDTHQSAIVNAQLLKSILNEINFRKKGHFDNLLIGESMGGILSRIALAEMESEGIEHEFRLFISFDSPHGGANTPLGLQELLYDAKNVDAKSLGGFLVGSIVGGLILDGALGGVVSGILVEQYITRLAENTVADEVEKKLPEFTLDATLTANNSQFSRETSIRINRYDDFENLEIFNGVYLNFQNHLNNLGFPSESRNVALYNGSNAGLEQTKSNGDPLILGQDLIERDTVKNTEFYVLVSPVNEFDFEVSRIHRIKNRFWLDFDEKGEFDFPPQPFDISPGSYSLDSVRFNFIPTTSAIALDQDLMFSPGGLYYFDETSSYENQQRRGIVESGLSPFDDLYGQQENTKHIQLNGKLKPVVDRMIEREFMFDNFDLNNRLFASGDIRYFHANEKLSVGREVNQWDHPESGKLITPGEVIVAEGASVRLTSEGRVLLAPGTTIQHGAKLEAEIVDPIAGCEPTEDISPSDYGVSILPYPNIAIEVDANNIANLSLTNAIPNAKQSAYRWEVFGMGEYRTGSGKMIKVEHLPPGGYTAVCHFANGHRSKSAVFSIVGTAPYAPKGSIESKAITASSFEIYPNPSNTNIQWTDGQPYHIMLINAAGQVIANRRNALSLDVSQLPQGTYFILLTNVEDESVRYRKVLLVE